MSKRLGGIVLLCSCLRGGVNLSNFGPRKDQASAMPCIWVHEIIRPLCSAALNGKT